jgi:hypothetical protein
MQLLSEEQMRKWVADRGWLTLADSRVANIRRITPVVPVECYDCDYKPSGDTGAGMAELFLKEFVPETVTTGMLHINRIFPWEPPQIAVLQHIVHLYGHDDFDPESRRFLFQNDYGGILTVMAWCIACDWEFDFVSGEHRFAVRKGEDLEIRVFWAVSQPIKPTVPQMMVNLECRKIFGFD